MVPYSKGLVVLLVTAMIPFGNLRADEPAAAPAPAAAAALPVEQLIEQLMQVKPEEIKARFDALKGETTKLGEDAKGLRTQADALDAKAAEMQKRIALLEQVIAAMNAPTSPTAQTAAAPAEGEAKMAEGKPEMKPEAKPEMKMAAAEPADAAPKMTYADNVAPILMAKCAGCHNQDKAKGGFALDTFEKMMEGGGSGKVIEPGNSGNSRLYKLIDQTEEPKMPMGGAKLDDASLEIVKKWIDQGALKDKNSKSLVKAAAASGAMAAAAPVIVVEGELPIPQKEEGVKLTALSGPLAVKSMASSPVAPVLAVSGYRQVLLYNSETLELLRALPFPEGVAEQIRFSSNGSLLVAAGGEAGKIGVAAVYDVVTGARVGEYGKSFDAVLTADISLDQTQVAVGGTNKKIRVYSTATGAQMYEITKHTDWIQTVKFSPDGWFLATADRAGGMYVWLAETGRDVHNLRGHEGAITSIDFRPDSRVLASGGIDGKVLLWELEDGKNIKGWGAHDKGVLSLTYAADGKIVTSGVDHLTALWDGDGNSLKKFPALGDWAYSACSSDKGARVIAGSWKGEVKVWQAADAAEVGALKLTP